jgi:hypothetical protein
LDSVSISVNSTLTSLLTGMFEETYTAMKPDAPVTSTFAPALIAGILLDCVCEYVCME